MPPPPFELGANRTGAQRRATDANRGFDKSVLPSQVSNSLDTNYQKDEENDCHGDCLYLVHN